MDFTYRLYFDRVHSGQICSASVGDVDSSVWLLKINQGNIMRLNVIWPDSFSCHT